MFGGTCSMGSRLRDDLLIETNPNPLSTMSVHYTKSTADALSKRESRYRVAQSIKKSKGEKVIERDDAQAECLEQARLLGMGSEREARLISERDDALSQIAQAECRAERFCQERDEAREKNAKLHYIVERAINYLNQSYRDGFADEVSDLRYEIEQLKEETK